MLTAERLHELLHYSPKTGHFLQRKTRGGIKAGAIVGSRHYSGYWHIQLDGKIYAAHRLAWLYMTGAWPQHEIDHKNRKRADNRFNNLREATKSQNKMNGGAYKNSTTGHKNIYWMGKEKLWRVIVNKDKKIHHIGCFKTLDAALSARNKAILEHHGSFACTG